jgi:hypothetical protein
MFYSVIDCGNSEAEDFVVILGLFVSEFANDLVDLEYN